MKFTKLVSLITAAAAAAASITLVPTTANADSDPSGIACQAADILADHIETDLIAQATAVAKTEEDLLDIYDGDIRKFDIYDVCDITFNLEGEWGLYSGPINYTEGDFTTTYYAAMQNGLWRSPASYSVTSEEDDFRADLAFNDEGDCFEVTVSYGCEVARETIAYNDIARPQDKGVPTFMTMSSTNGEVYAVTELAVIGIISNCIDQLGELLMETETAPDEPVLGPPLAWSDDLVQVSDDIATYMNNKLAENTAKIAEAYNRALENGADVRNLDAVTLLNDAGFQCTCKSDENKSYYYSNDAMVRYTEALQDDLGRNYGGKIEYVRNGQTTTLIDSAVDNCYSFSTFGEYAGYDAIGRGTITVPVEAVRYFAINGETQNGVIDVYQIAAIATLIEFAAGE